MGEKLGEEERIDESQYDLLDAILNRRTCRAFTPAPIEFEKIAEIIQAGMEAPSSGNLQNWKFIVITDKEKLRELFHHTLEQEAFLTAPVGVIVCSDDEIAQTHYGLRGKRLYAIQNCAACIQNMLLMAHALELGACWIGAFDEERLDAMFSIPKGIRAQAIILLGEAEEEPEPKERKNISHLVYFNAYGERVKRPHIVLRDYSEEWRQRIAAIKKKAAQHKKNLPTKEELQEHLNTVGEKSQDFYQDTKKRLDKVLANLKDEQKQRK